MQMPQPDDALCAGYKIVRRLAQGSCTTVYEARPTHPKLRDRPVTLKVLRHYGDPRHFMRAARINAFLDHPRIPSLYEVKESGERLYSSRTFVEGEDLRIGTVTRSVTEVATIINEVAAILDYAHGRGVIHGSVHPRHLLLGRDRAVWLIGFGEYPTPDTELLGNPLHLAPEQLEAGGAATPACDVYALSETALWLLCGQHPFAGVRAIDLLEAKRTGDLQRRIRELSWGIPRSVEQVLLRGLAAEPAGRYAKAGEFAAALSSVGSARRWWFWR